jgi:hypothetical protein
MTVFPAQLAQSSQIAGEKKRAGWLFYRRRAATFDFNI